MHTSRHPNGMFLITMRESNVITINRDRWAAWAQATNEYWHYRNAAKVCSMTQIHQPRRKP